MSTDQQGNAPQLMVSINRDQAARFGIMPEVIDATLNDAFGQRQVAQYYTQTNTYHVILEVPPEMQGDPNTLDRIYLKSPLTGASVPISTLVTIDNTQVGPLSVSHQGQFPAITLSFNLPSGMALGQAVDAINKAVLDMGTARNPDRHVPGQRASLSGFARQRAGADRRGARRRLSDPRHAV